MFLSIVYSVSNLIFSYNFANFSLRLIMKCNIVLSGENLIDYQAFNLFFSKKARKQYFINVFMIFTEAIIAGFVADMLLKTKIFTIIGTIFAIFWIIFYPIFLKNRRRVALKSLEISDFKKEMIFEVDEKNLAFYENEKIHLVLPKNKETSELVKTLIKESKKELLLFENLDYKSVIG